MILNKVNNKSYIGQSLNIEHRFVSHKSMLRKGSHNNKYLLNAWNKYGENNFEFVVIEECDYERLDYLEKFYIKKYNTFAKLENSNGYNLCEGGNGTTGLVGGLNPNAVQVVCEGITFETIKECAEYYGENSTTMRGWLTKYYDMPIEFFKKGLSIKGVPIDTYKPCNHSRKKRKKILAEDVEFDSVVECAKHFDVKYATMCGYLNGSRKMPKKFIDIGLKFEIDDIKYEQKKDKRVFCNGIIYNGVKECANAIGINDTTLSKVLNGNRNMPKKFNTFIVMYACDVEGGDVV